MTDVMQTDGAEGASLFKSIADLRAACLDLPPGNDAAASAVAARQAYETKQIKQTFRSKEAKADIEGVVAQTEKEREPLVAAIKAAFVPVTHTIKISGE